MIKNKNMKEILENWYSKSSLISEKVFYGAGKNFVITTSNYKDFGDCYLIYDDYISLLNKNPSSDYSFSGIRCLSKQEGKIEDEVTFFIESVIEEMFFRSYKKFPGSHDIVKKRLSLYKSQYPNIFSDDKLIIFNPFPKVKGSEENEMQRPKIQDKHSGKRVKQNISAKNLSGSDYFLFDPAEYETYDRVKRGNLKNPKKLKRGTLATNINWTIHDLGHTIMDEINDEYSEIDYQERNEFIESDVYQKIYGKDYSKKNQRKLDRLHMLFDSIKNVSEYENLINKNIYIDLRKMIEKFTPGVGLGDQEYSLFAKMLQIGDKDRVSSIVNQIIQFCMENIDKLNKKVVDFFKLNNSDTLLKDFLYDIFESQDKIAKNFFDNIKVVFASI